MEGVKKGKMKIKPRLLKIYCVKSLVCLLSRFRARIKFLFAFINFR